MRKHLLESQNQKAKHRDWRECLLVVSQGEFRMYGVPSENHGENRLHMLKSGGSSFVNLADSLSKNFMDTSPALSHKSNHSVQYPTYVCITANISSIGLYTTDWHS